MTNVTEIAGDTAERLAAFAAGLPTPSIASWL